MPSPNLEVGVTHQRLDTVVRWRPPLPNPGEDLMAKGGW